MKNKTKRRVIIALGSDFHCRSFFSGNLLEELSNKFEVRLVFSQDVNPRYIPSGLTYNVIPTYSFAKRLFVSVLDASLIRNLSKSSSFRFRVKRMLFGDYDDGFPLSIRGTLRFLRGLLFSIPGPFYLLKRAYISFVRANQSFRRIVLDFKPSLIVCWAQTNEPMVVHATVLAKSSNATSVLVFDNWDNLCSKSVILVKPHHVVCFGYQAKEHAISIHDLSPEQVHPVGSARFDSYLSIPKTNANVKSQVVIAGSSIALEDSAILKLISRQLLIGSLVDIADRFKFVYRPHPFPQGSSINLDQWDYHPIVPRSGFGAWQDQKEIAKELSKNKLVISAPTTLLLESLLAGSWVVVPSLPAVSVKTSTQQMLLNLEHLRSLDKLHGVTVVTDEKTVINVIREKLETNLSKEFDENLQYFVVHSPASFASRLSKLLSQIA